MKEVAGGCLLEYEKQVEALGCNLEKLIKWQNCKWGINSPSLKIGGDNKLSS